MMSLSLIKPVYAACEPGQGNINLGDCLTLGAGSNKTVSQTYGTPAALINVLVKNLFVIAGIILFLTILYSGYKFIAQGTKGKDEAKTILTAAVSGFIIMFVSYWIVQIMEILTGVQIFI
jgi:hypothetical protein